jgi:hypothetical protein
MLPQYEQIFPQCELFKIKKRLGLIGCNPLLAAISAYEGIALFNWQCILSLHR